MHAQSKDLMGLRDLIELEVRSAPLFLLRERLCDAVIGHLTRKFSQAYLVASPEEKKRLEALYAHIVAGV